MRLAGPLALLAAAACAHAADPATQGPSLKGIVGRPVAGEEGFAYSLAMSNTSVLLLAKSVTQTSSRWST